MKQRRKIQMTGQENFRISSTNPNAGAGMPGCLGCGSHRCPGPFMVFPTRVTIPGARRACFMSVSLSCAKKAVIDYERGAEVAVVGNARPGEDGPPAEQTEEQRAEREAYFRTGVGVGESAKPIDEVRLAMTVHNHDTTGTAPDPTAEEA